MHSFRKPVVACAALCACFAFLAASAIPAVAGKPHQKIYKTSSSLIRGKDAIKGKLSSPKPACLRHRVVRGELFPGGPPIPLGTIRSDGSGRWSFEGPSLEATLGGLRHFLVEILVTGKSLGGGATCEGVHLKKVFT